MALFTVACGGLDEAVTAADDDPTIAESFWLEGEHVDREAGASRSNSRLLDAVADAKRRWEEMGLSSYRVKTRLSCFCPRRPSFDVAVAVSDGEVITALGNDGSGSYVIPIEPELFRDWYTVAGMFERIERSLPTVDELQAEFDPDRGYPTKLAFDYTLASADEGEFFEMWDLSPID